MVFVTFQDGLQFEYYWTRGPGRIYVIRIWYTNVFHIIIDAAILVLPTIWIRRARLRRLGKPVYLLLFLSGVL